MYSVEACNAVRRFVFIEGHSRLEAARHFHLLHFDACFVKAYPVETTEVSLDGQVSAFVFFGSVEQPILYGSTELLLPRS